MQFGRTFFGRVRVAVGLAVSLAALAPEGAARAQASQAVLLPPEASDSALAEMGGAVERVLRAQMDELEVGRFGATPALGLEDLQLAVGCVARSSECFSAVAAQLDTDSLVMPSLERAGDEIVVSLTIFDRQTGRTRSAMRRVARDGAVTVLDVLDELVREAYGLPPAVEVAPVEGATPEGATPEGTTPEAAPPSREGESAQERDPGPAIGAGVLLGVGVITVAVGAAFGVAALGSMDAYEAASVGTAAEVDAALALLDRAGTEATLANVLVPIGAAVAVGGAVWLIVELASGSDEGERPVAFTPFVGPDVLGASFVGSF